MRRLLVLAPNVAPYPGGAEIYMSRLMDGLSKKKWEIICATENPPIEKNSNNIRYIKTIANIKKITSENTVTWREMQFSMLDSLHDSLKNEKFDIIHANSIEASILGKIISDHLNIPILATIHEHNPEKKAYGNGRTKLVFERLDLDGFITPSSFYYDYVLSNNVNKNKIFKIFHGIDFPKVQHLNNLYQLKSCLKILFVGRVYFPKGLHILIKALSLLNSNIKFNLKIVGPITDIQYKRKIEDLISFYGFKGKINFMGATDFKQIKKYMLQSNVLIVPSINEGFGLSIIEANLLKLPVIASSVGGILDIIEDNKNGLLFESKNIVDLKNKIEYLFDNYKQTLCLANNAYYKTINLFSQKRMVEETIYAYEKIIKRKKSISS